MRNNKKADDAILMALMQDIEAVFGGNAISKNAASTGAIALSDIQRDGPDQGDIHNVIENDIFDRTGNVPDKIRNQLFQHPELVNSLKKNVGDAQFATIIDRLNSRNGLSALYQVISDYLTNTRKYAEGGQFEDNQNMISLKINDKEYNLLVAKTEEEKELGLQNVESMEDNEGMYFDYTDDPQEELSFWMKDTTIPLDIIFISDEDEVIDVKSGEPESEELLTCTAVKNHLITGVIELNANSGVKKGDEVDFEDFDENEHPELEPNKMYVIGSDGTPQAELSGGERIFSRISTRKILKAAKKAFLSKQDKDYKKLGKIVFEELTAQDKRDPQYVDSKK